MTLFHAAAGRPPFPEESGIVVLSRHLFDEIPDVRLFRPRTLPPVSPRLSEAIWRLTRKDPSRRYGSVMTLTVVVPSRRIP